LINQRRDAKPDLWRAANLKLAIGLAAESPSSASPQKPLHGANSETSAMALTFELASDVVREGASMTLKAAGKISFPGNAPTFDRAHWNGDLEVVNFPAALLKDYAGARLPVKSMDGYVAQRVHFEGNPATFLRAQGAIAFRQLSLDAPELFLAPLAGLDGRVNFSMERSKRDLRLLHGDLRANDIHLSLSGRIDDLGGEDPRVQLTFSTAPAAATALIRYLPLKLLGWRRIESAVTAIQAGRLEIKKATVRAALSELREPATAAKQLAWDAELRDFAAQGDQPSLPLRVAHGKMSFTGGVVRIADFRGAYGDSRFTQVDANYDFAGTAPGKLEVEAHGDINLAEFKDQAGFYSSAERISKVLSSLKQLNGRAKLDLVLRQSPGEPAQFDAKMAVEHARLSYGDIALSEARGDFALTPDAIAGERIRAQLGGSPIQARLMLNDYTAPDGMFDLHVDSPGVKAGVITQLLLDTGNPLDPGIVRGAVRYFGALHDPQRRKFTGALDLTNVELLFRPLLQPLRELNGRIRIDETGIDFQDLKALLVGVPASATGRWRYAGAPQLTFDFAAPNLDITYLISQLDPESSPFYANLIAEGKIAIAKGRVKNFEFGDLQTEVSLKRRVWRLSNLTALSAGGTIHGDTTVFDRPETLGLVGELRVQAVPVQSFLRWFDVTQTEMSGRVNIAGALETVGKSDLERKQNLHGAFNLRIEEGTIQRMRILVQILNLLDLSRWFTLQLPDLAKDGIRFRAITGDFKVVKGVYTTQNLVIDSNDLRMTGAGKIDVPNDTLDFIVAVRPFAGIDTALSYIPLIGRGVAAIKNSFLVASFNIQGPIDRPTITPAPLGTVNEWFWGVLGIPKNVIGLGDGETAELPGAKQPAK
jgi:uncharacterized protein YhdP